MKQSRGFNLRRVVIVAAVLLVVGIILLFWAKDVVREVIVIPLSYLFWVINLFIQATPQMFFWFSLIVITLMIAYRGLSGRKSVYADLPHRLNELPSQRDTSGRVVYWMGKVNLMQARRGLYFQNSFHIAVARLLIEQLAHRYRLQTNQVEDQLKDGSLQVPNEVREYVLSSLRRLDINGVGFFTLLWRSITESFRNLFRRWTTVEQTRTIDPQVEYILRYMEEELEVLHDDSGQ